MHSQKIKYSRIGIRLIFEHFVNVLYVCSEILTYENYCNITKKFLLVTSNDDSMFLLF